MKQLQNNLLKNRTMKRESFTKPKNLFKVSKHIFLLTLLSLFLFSSCSATKKCDGGKKIKTQMW